ncbi:MAG: TCP-1/cpn60 chaperonin family protein [Symbiobacteriia bacterium]
MTTDLPSTRSSGDEPLAALYHNLAAVRAMALAVEGTLGSKGLDTMLVDAVGQVVVTNDGLTILTSMAATHPAARMVVSMARAQEQAVGDGTTTATLLTAAILEEAAAHAAHGVPVSRLVEGLQLGAKLAQGVLAARTRQLAGPGDERLQDVARVAARGDQEIAELARSAARRLVGDGEPGTSAAQRNPAARGGANSHLRRIVAREGADCRLVPGLALRREPLAPYMPNRLEEATVLVLDDALEPEFAGPEAARTEAGIARQLQEEESFRALLGSLVAQGVGAVVCSRVAGGLAEEILGQAGVLILERVPRLDLLALADHLGAQPLRRAALRRDPARLQAAFGHCGQIQVEEPLGLTWFESGCGRPAVTLLVGAATPEVLEERRRVAEDAAAAAAAALSGGVLPGGGATEVALSRALARESSRVQGMATYGIAALVEALKRPLAQMAANAGYSPLEKLSEVLAAQARAEEAGEAGHDALGIDLDSGLITDMGQLGVWDPAPVKQHALAAAVETAIAILRIRLIVQKPVQAGSGGRERDADTAWQEGDLM